MILCFETNLSSCCLGIHCRYLASLIWIQKLLISHFLPNASIDIRIFLLWACLLRIKASTTIESLDKSNQKYHFRDCFLVIHLLLDLPQWIILYATSILLTIKLNRASNQFPQQPRKLDVQMSLMNNKRPITWTRI